MLFALFFGAGNLIFPPWLGVQAGTESLSAFIGFLITAVGFPILGVMAVAESGGLKNLGARVHPVFAFIFMFLIYLRRARRSRWWCGRFSPRTVCSKPRF